MLIYSSIIRGLVDPGPLCCLSDDTDGNYCYLIDSGFRVIFRSFLVFGGRRFEESWADDLREREALLLLAKWII